MNTTVAEGVELAKGIVAKVNDISKGVSLIVAPPFTHLVPVGEVLKGSPVALSAQDCADQPKGAFTGEVSAAMLKGVGCAYTILGHSERREYYGETSAKLVKKMALAFENGLKVIFCVGEKIEQREMGHHFDVVSQQVSEVLFDLTPEQMKNVIIAYEPVWAIGTGRTAAPAQAQDMCREIRAAIREGYDARTARAVTVQYGGSMNPANAAELLAQPDVDGGLIGGASLDPGKFYQIVEAAKL
jgi:triosephosphate isomerase